LSTLDDVKTAPVRRESGGPGWWERTRVFLAEVRNELRRVTWPSGKEVYATTVVVILVSIFFGLYLYGVDYVFGLIVQAIFRHFGAA
jgi:preprotein translocase subunit SecE